MSENMTELQAAAERCEAIRLGSTIGEQYGHSREDHKLHTTDLYMLSDIGIKYLPLEDLRPLSELSNSERRELGFTFMNVDGWLSRGNDGSVEINSCGDVILHGCHDPRITTVGQLRHLLMALGR